MREEELATSELLAVAMLLDMPPRELDPVPLLDAVLVPEAAALEEPDAIPLVPEVGTLEEPDAAALDDACPEDARELAGAALLERMVDAEEDAPLLCDEDGSVLPLEDLDASSEEEPVPAGGRRSPSLEQ